MSFFKQNNNTIYYEVHGKGFPLVLISGLGGCSASWLPVLNVLSRYFRVIVFDNRGAGRSSVPDKPYEISDMSEDLYYLLKYLNITSTHIIGHSMGGYIAQEFAIKYPEITAKLILSNTMERLSKRNKYLFKNLYDLWKLDIQEGQRVYGVETNINKTGTKECKNSKMTLRVISRSLWFKELFFWIFSKKIFEDGVTFDAAVEFAVNYKYQQSLQGFKGQVDACIKHDTSERLGAIKSNTLVLSGSDDILITPDESSILHDKIKNSVMSIIQDCGHTPHFENRKKYIDSVLTFLK